LYSIAISEICSKTLRSTSSSTPMLRKISRNWRWIESRGSVMIRTSISRDRSPKRAITGSRPVNSGMSP
jgi:hypothetical protein